MTPGRTRSLLMSVIASKHWARCIWNKRTVNNGGDPVFPLRTGWGAAHHNARCVWCAAPVTLCGCISAWLQRDTPHRRLRYYQHGSFARSTMETKPVITCLKTLLIVYSFVFWVRNLSPSSFFFFFFFKKRNPAENDRSTHPNPPFCVSVCACVFVVRDEGVDSGSIIDGITPLFRSI